jgi:mono/diheme cytochrome c family protein
MPDLHVSSVIRRRWAIVIAAGILPALVNGCKGAPTSTLDGVYTKQQAVRGKNIYGASCTSCHNLASHTGTTFAQYWGGHPLSDMYEYIGISMPKNNPGMLSEQETADVMAYILQLNAMPVGHTELPADSGALAKIRVNIAKHGP